LAWFRRSSYQSRTTAGNPPDYECRWRPTGSPRAFSWKTQRNPPHPDSMLQPIRSERQIRSPILKWPRCGHVGEGANPQSGGPSHERLATRTRSSSRERWTLLWQRVSKSQRLFEPEPTPATSHRERVPPPTTSSRQTRKETQRPNNSGACRLERPRFIAWRSIVNTFRVGTARAVGDDEWRGEA
jgi:hypothetical protein